MSKRKKVLVVLGVIVLAAVCFAKLLRPNEPKYNGRYLSEWVTMAQRLEQVEEAKRAILAIGTNGMRCYIKWIRYEPVGARISLYRKLPRWMKANRTVQRWLIGPIEHADCAVFGIWYLGTNAACAIPELNVIMRDGTKPWAASKAIDALAGIGEPAIPVLTAALADRNQTHRWKIVDYALRVRAGHTNAWLPALIESLKDPDADVRWRATNAIKSIDPQLLTNSPAE